jgi:hypothetical protein
MALFLAHQKLENNERDRGHERQLSGAASSVSTTALGSTPKFLDFIDKPMVLYILYHHDEL